MWMRPFSFKAANLLFQFSKHHKKDLYQILGVNRTASQSQIKKAYHKLAHAHHPDKNESPESKDKFSEINHAYQILSDEQKRQFYDQTGSTDSNPFAGFENEEMFNSFRGGFGGHQGGMGGFQSIFEDLFGGFQEQGARKPNMPQKIILKAELAFEEAVNGTEKTINYHKKCTCSTCKGSKSKPGTQPQKCGTCQGTGFMTFRQGMMVLRSACNACNGEGKKITSPCGTCKGSGIESIAAHEKIVFPQGIDNEANLRFKGKGHMNGDLQIKVHVKKHPTITRQGIDAHSTQEISVLDAVLGCQIYVKTIYGQTKTLRVQGGCQNGEQLKLAKEGFYRVNTSSKGSHIVTIKVKVPTSISEQERKLYEALSELKKEKSKLQQKQEEPLSQKFYN